MRPEAGSKTYLSVCECVWGERGSISIFNVFPYIRSYIEREKWAARAPPPPHHSNMGNSIAKWSVGEEGGFIYTMGGGEEL